MKVRELIEALSAMPQDYDVRICSTNACYNENETIAGCLDNITEVFVHKYFNGKEVAITNGLYYFDAEKIKR